MLPAHSSRTAHEELLPTRSHVWKLFFPDPTRGTLFLIIFLSITHAFRQLLLPPFWNLVYGDSDPPQSRKLSTKRRTHTRKWLRGDSNVLTGK